MVDIESKIQSINQNRWCPQYIYEDIKELINAGVSIRYIEEHTRELPVFDIIDGLLKLDNSELCDPVIKKAIVDYYDSLNINQEKCLIIADNHMGRIMDGEDKSRYNDPNYCYENERGIYNAYNYALKFNISNIIHLGDIIEGNSSTFESRLKAERNENHQLEYFKRVYPNPSGIKTYLLYGNHDYNTIKYDSVDIKFYKAHSNIELIGVNYTYINFCGYRIKLSHESNSTSLYRNIDLDHELKIAGHSHSYSVYEDWRIVKAPSISSASEDTTGIGFLEMIDEENEFVFKFINQNGIEVPAKERVLTKRKIIL